MTETQIAVRENSPQIYCHPDECLYQTLKHLNDSSHQRRLQKTEQLAFLQVFLDSSMPVVNHYDTKGKVYKFKSDRSPDDIYSEVRQLFLDL